MRAYFLVSPRYITYWKHNLSLQIADPTKFLHIIESCRFWRTRFLVLKQANFYSQRTY